MDPSKPDRPREMAKLFIRLGEAKLLVKLLAAKNLGALEPDTLARIQHGTLEELETWAMRVINATSLADVFDA